MDESVLRAIARWPDVPAVYGWLGLDRRGRWRLRGEPITHPGAIAFIGRNYQGAEDGTWFFQNGPQRVYVELDYTPWVYRFDVDSGFTTHTGVAAGIPSGAWLDEGGAVLVMADPGVGIVDDRDLGRFAELLTDDEDGRASELEWRGRRLAIGSIRAAEVPARFGFVQHPDT